MLKNVKKLKIIITESGFPKLRMCMNLKGYNIYGPFKIVVHLPSAIQNALRFLYCAQIPFEKVEKVENC